MKSSQWVKLGVCSEIFHVVFVVTWFALAILELISNSSFYILEFSWSIVVLQVISAGCPITQFSNWCFKHVDNKNAHWYCSYTDAYIFRPFLSKIIETQLGFKVNDIWIHLSSILFVIILTMMVM